MEKKQIYLAPQATIFSFVPGERLSADADPWIDVTQAVNSGGGFDVTSSNIQIDTEETYGPEDP